MRIRRVVFWFAFVAILIALWMWFGRKSVTTQLPNQPSSNISSLSPTTGVITAQPKSTPIPSNPSITQVAPGVPASPPVATKGAQMKEGLAQFNDENIVLYGKVIDQFEKPVGNATVAGSIQVNNGTREGSDKMSVITDANGVFTISGYKGKALGINVRKAGYVMATANTRFIYSRLWADAERYTPDPSNPAIIKMWKLQGAEPLRGINQHYKFRFSAAPVYFDLLAGQIVSFGGDIKITMSRSAGIVSERTLQDWGVQIEVVDGGMIQTSSMDSRFTYALPKIGYQPSATFILSTNAPHQWSGTIDQNYFIQSRTGQVFAKINISIAINQQPDGFVYVEFRGEANPNASGNFESDANAAAMESQ